MSKAQRDKGHNYEREIARLFREIYPDSARHLEYQKDEAKKGVDVIAGPFLIQCKRRKDWVPAKTIYEVQPQEGKVPLLVCRTTESRCKSLVILFLFDFEEKFKNKNFVVDALFNPGSYPSLKKAESALSWFKREHKTPAVALCNKKENNSLIAMFLSHFLEITKTGVQNDLTS